MFPRPTLWAHHCRVHCVGAIDDFRSVLLAKVVGAFSRIEEEADLEAEMVHEELVSAPMDVTDLLYLDDFENLACEHGMAYHHTLNTMRQAALNMLAMTLYHLFEQQQAFFLDREPPIAPTRRLDKDKTEMDQRMLTYGIDCGSFSCSRRLAELREVANAIKHSKGRASAKLVELRPDLFTSDMLRRIHSEADLPYQVRVVADIAGAPLAGEYIYVTEQHLAEWCEAARAYWTALAEIVDEFRKRTS